MDCPDETRLLSLADGRASGPERESLLGHVEGCDSCRRVLAQLLDLHSDTVTPSSGKSKNDAPASLKVGRFELGRELGAGGLGVVFEAVDPVLGRKVAIKLVRSRLLGTAEHTERLLREAQAMAQVSHPHVVTVFEAGRDGDDVYIAMEILPGGTLKAWLASPRTPAEILARLLEAGEGLAAAHEQGLVHRDFKPDNVLIDAHGKSRVADFGLARGSLERLEAVAISADSLASPLTMTGALLGTPAYMAPEQLQGKPVDARADQFSFCVALYEALAGLRPHTGRSVSELLASIRAQQWRPPLPGRTIDPRTRAVLTRGLALDPDARFPSMRALLTALRPPEARASKWIAAGLAAAVALAALGASGMAVRRRAIETECQAGLSKLAPVWSPERTAALDAAFAAISHPYAASSLRQTRAALESWVAGWGEAWGSACRSARLDGLQSTELMDLRFACLESRRSELDALLGALTHVDVNGVLRAPAAAEGLGRVALCADTGFLLAAAKGPRSDTSPEAQSVRVLVREAIALTDLAKLDDAKTKATEALALAQQLKKRGLEAEARLALGRALAARRGKDDAIAPLEAAVEAALASAHDEVAFSAWRQLAFTEGYDQSKFESALKRLALAQAAAERLGNPATLRLDLAFTRGSVQLKQGALAESEQSFLEALGLARSSGDRMTVARTLNNLATVKSGQDQREDSVKYQRQAIEQMTAVLGELHPNIALLTMNRGVDELNGGDPTTALATFDRALELARKAFGAEHPSVFAALLNRGKALTALHRDDEARTALEESLAAMKAAKAPPDDVAQVLQSLAVNASATGDYARSLTLNQEALALREGSVGKDAAATGVSLNNTANTLMMLGKPKEARPLYERALEIFGKTLPPEHTYVGHALQGEGAALLELGEAKPALAALERARTFVMRDEPAGGARTVGLAGHLARAHAALGKPAEGLALLEAVEPHVEALPLLAKGQHFAARAEVAWEAGQRPAAREAARVAAEAFASAGSVAAPEAARLAQWTARHP